MKHNFRGGNIGVAAVLVSVFALASTPLAGASPDGLDEPSQQHEDPNQSSADSSNTNPSNSESTDLGLLPTTPPVAQDYSEPLTDNDIVEIEDAGGYSVDSSKISEGLLVAENGADPIPIDDRVWGEEEQDPNLIDLSIELMAICDAHPGNLAGVAFAAESLFLEVYAKDPSGEGIAEIAQLLEERQMVGTVVIVPVDYSYSDLQAAQDALLSEYDDEVAISIDAVENRVVAMPITSEAEADLPSTEGPEDFPLSDLTPDLSLPSGESENSDIADVPVSLEDVEETEGTGRYDDYAPFAMGGSIRGPETCSLGVPIFFNNKKMVLTAGHCGMGQFWNGNRESPVGKSWANAVVAGNAYRFGDWQLLSGSTYYPHIWNTPPNNAYSTLPIASVYWGQMAAGTSLCSSGQTTGQICRYYVTTPLTSVDVDKVLTGRITKMTHQGTKGKIDTGGWRGGDSGGPVYYNNGAGRMVVVGIVTSSPSDHLSYSFTQLNGVQAAYPSARYGY